MTLIFQFRTLRGFDRIPRSLTSTGEFVYKTTASPSQVDSGIRFWLKANINDDGDVKLGGKEAHVFITSRHNMMCTYIHVCGNNI